jgi:hypothetical protein
MPSHPEKPEQWYIFQKHFIGHTAAGTAPDSLHFNKLPDSLLFYDP